MFPGYSHVINPLNYKPLVINPTTYWMTTKNLIPRNNFFFQFPIMFTEIFQMKNILLHICYFHDWIVDGFEYFCIAINYKTSARNFKIMPFTKSNKSWATVRLIAERLIAFRICFWLQGLTKSIMSDFGKFMKFFGGDTPFSGRLSLLGWITYTLV